MNKKEPTIKEAKKMCLEVHSKMSKTMSSFGITHSKYVIKACKDLIEEKKISLNINDIEIVGWLHDIGYIVSEENHAEHSLKLAEEKFLINPIIRDCILNHGSDSNPQTEEGKIMKLADKLSFFYKPFIKIITNNEIERGATRTDAWQKMKEKLEKFKNKFQDKDYQAIILKLK